MCRQVNSRLREHHALPFRTHLLVLLAYFLLSIGLTWPLIVQWHTAIVGGTGSFTYYGSFEDGSQNVWNIWWVRQAIAHRQNPFWATLLYYPQGVQMYMQTMNISNALYTLPVQYLAGTVAAFNTAILLAFTLTGYAGFLLVRAFVPGVYIPFFCGVLLTACPFHVFKLQVNQLHLMSMQWVPLYFLALIRLEFPSEDATRRRDDDMDGNPLQVTDYRLQLTRLVGIAHCHLSPITYHLKTPRRILASTVFAVAMFVLVVLTDWYWALLCAVYTAVWATLSLIRSPARGRLMVRYLMVGGGVLLCLTPLLVGMAQVRDHLPASLSLNPHWEGYTAGFSADAFGLFFPSVNQPLWGTWAQQWTQALSPPYGPDGWYIAAGWVLLLCAAWGIWVSWRTHWQLLIVSGVAWLFSLGPTLRIAGTDTGIPMPFALIQDLPLISAGRRPSHLAVIVIVLATVFAGIGLHHIRQYWPQRQSMLFFASIIGLSIIEFCPPPRNVYRFEQPLVYQYLAQAPGAVADLPLSWRENARTLRNQMVHGQPILGGFVARWPDYPILRYQPLLYQIGRMRPWPEGDIVPVSSATLQAMQCHTPIRHVVLHKDVETTGSYESLDASLTMLNGEPLVPAYENATYVWYELPLFEDQCQPFLYLGAGWYHLEHNLMLSWRRASATNDLWLVNPFDEPIIAHITMTAEGFETARPIEVWQDDRRIAAWEVTRARRPYQWLVHLPPGTHRLQIRAATGWDAVTEREVSMAVMDLRIQDYTVLKAEN